MGKGSGAMIEAWGRRRRRRRCDRVEDVERMERMDRSVDCAWEKLPGGEKRMDGLGLRRRPTRRLTMCYQSLFFF